MRSTIISSTFYNKQTYTDAGIRNSSNIEVYNGTIVRNIADNNGDVPFDQFDIDSDADTDEHLHVDAAGNARIANGNGNVDAAIVVVSGAYKYQS